MSLAASVTFAVIPASNVALGADYMAIHHAVTEESHGCIYLKNKAVTVDLVAVRLLAARLLVMKTGNHN